MLTTMDLANLVLKDEMAGATNTEDIQSAVERTYQKLRIHLSIRLGSEGFQTLFKRAVTLVAIEYPWMKSIQVTKENTVEGFQNIAGAEATAEECVAVVAQLIEMLDTFIGRDLTVRMLHGGWPNISMETLSRQGDSNE